jgi:uncharacterized membrane protein YdfJ with MMPL/SSD domain
LEIEEIIVQNHVSRYYYAVLEQVSSQSTLLPAKPASLGRALWSRPTVEEESDFWQS